MILGHKSIKSTETSIHIEKMMYEGDANDQFIFKVAATMPEATRLIVVGFEYHAEVEGHKLFRNRFFSCCSLLTGPTGSLELRDRRLATKQ